MVQAAATPSAWAPLREVLGRIGAAFISPKAAEQCICRGIAKRRITYRARWSDPEVAAAHEADIADAFEWAQLDMPRNTVTVTLQVAAETLPGENRFGHRVISRYESIHAPPVACN